MKPEDSSDAAAASEVALEALPTLLASSTEDVLRSLIDNPAFDETHVCLLLQRKDLSGALLEEISKRKTWRGAYRVRLGLAAHPHTPRLIAMRMLRDLHLMDLVRIALLPTSSMELRRLADERVLARLPQLPLGHKLMLARRGSARVAAGLIAEGTTQVALVALDNAFLTESQLLKALAGQSLPARIVGSVAKHDKWSKLINVRVAVLRHPRVPLERVPALVRGLPRREIDDLLRLTRVAGYVRAQLREELATKGKV
jgi:hypothetical protein